MKQNGSFGSFEHCISPGTALESKGTDDNPKPSGRRFRSVPVQMTCFVTGLFQ